MTHLLDTSALLAHYLAEPGATRVQVLFEDTASKWVGLENEPIFV
jgi:PIN domain nuclease of toxin-antitoxin system